MTVARTFIFAIVSTIVTLPLLAQPDGGGYLFTGVIPLKGHKNELCPILGSTNRRLLIETRAGVKKTKFGQSNVALRQTIAASPHFAEIENFDFSLDNRAQFRRAGALQRALEADIAYAQRKMDEIDTTERPEVVGQPKGMSKEEFRSNLSESSGSSNELMGSLFGAASRLADTIYLSFDIVPDTDFQSAFAAVVLTHDQFDESGNVVGRLAIPSLEKVGNLKGGIPNKVSLELHTREQLLSNLDLKLYLFSRKGEAIATNLSGSIKKISDEEFAELKSAQK